MTTTTPASLTMPCNTSVQMTASNPPMSVKKTVTKPTPTMTWYLSHPVMPQMAVVMVKSTKPILEKCPAVNASAL